MHQSRIAPFIQRAKDAGLRSQVPDERAFLAECEGACLIMSESLPDEREKGFALISLAFGEPKTPSERLPRLALRYDFEFERWMLVLEPRDGSCADFTAFAEKFFAAGADRMDVACSELLLGIIDEFIARVKPVSLAYAS